MKQIALLIIAAWMLAGLQTGIQAEETRYVGGDISQLLTYEQHNSPYKDVYGKNISDLITWFMQDCGWNTFRVRIFVNPDKTDPSLQQDLNYVVKLGKRIKAAGAYFLLDFHYSDSWVDAGHIQAPKAWQGLDDAQMAEQLGQYTHNVLGALKANAATPDLVQVGNEIMYGLCDRRVAPYDKEGTNWEGYLGLLRAGCNAVREECPNAQIIIHTDRPCNISYDFYYYNKLRKNDVDFDIIGLSYYPFWHADMSPKSTNTGADVLKPLVKAVNYLASQFTDKKVQIVEFAYNFQYWPTEGVNYDTRPVWPATKEGQYNFVKDLVDALKPLPNLTGINYWFPEEAGNGDDTNWSTSKGTALWTWQNRGFWDENQSNNGHAINKIGAATGDKTPADVCAPYYMKNFYDEEQGLERTQNTDRSADRVQKVFVDGQVVIQKGDKRYTIFGQEL